MFGEAPRRQEAEAAARGEGGDGRGGRALGGALSGRAAGAGRAMAAKDNPCRKFQANIFNKSKCQNCFKPRESHLLNDEDLNQVGPPPLPPCPELILFPPDAAHCPPRSRQPRRLPCVLPGCLLAPWVARGATNGVEPRGRLTAPQVP